MSAPRTVIRWNGSGAVLPLEALFARLESDVLDPRFEEYGGFVSEGVVGWPGAVEFFGNFLTYSHAFSVQSDDPAVLGRLRAAFAAHLASAPYREVLADHRAGVPGYHWTALVKQAERTGGPAPLLPRHMIPEPPPAPRVRRASAQGSLALTD